MDAVKQHIMRWGKAWSGQDVDTYLNSYVSGYAPGNISNQQWQQTRQQRILSPRNIQVNILNLKIEMSNRKSATAVFRQQYRSNVLQSNIIKRLRLIKYKEGWKIVDEK